MDAATAQYSPANPGSGCGYIPPPATTDDSYLETGPGVSAPTIMWNYWYSDNQNSPGCVFTNTDTITAWQDLETQNGGG